MLKFTDPERKRLTIGLAQTATKAALVQANLISKGHGAFVPIQQILFEFAESSDEESDLNAYFRELAKEALGAVHRPGTGIVGGDGFRSDYLEELRRRRDHEVGSFEDYKKTPSGRWRFEINPVIRRFGQFRAERPDDFRRRDEVAHKAAQSQMAQEAEQCCLREFGSDFSYGNPMLEYLYEAYFAYLKLDGLVIGKSNLSELKPIAAFPIHEDWSVGIYINMPQHFLQPAVNLTLIDQHIVLVKRTPEETVKRQLTDKADYHRLRLEDTIYGFGVYRGAGNSSEIALAVKVTSQLLSEFVGDIKALVRMARQA